MVCTVEMVSVKGLGDAAGISGESWPGPHCNLLSLKSAVNWGPVMKGSGNGVTVSAGNVFIRGVASVKSIRRSPGSKVKAPPRSEGLLAPGDSWFLPSEF